MDESETYSSHLKLLEEPSGTSFESSIYHNQGKAKTAWGDGVWEDSIGYGGKLEQRRYLR